MAHDSELIEIERRLWTNDAAFYEDALIKEALLVLPAAGVIAKHLVVDAILAENADGRRCADVEFDEVRSLSLADDAAVLTYRVAARRDPQSPKGWARASSVYVRRNGKWKLAFHQHTPFD